MNHLPTPGATPTWPTSTGDHRAAHRSSAPGACNGRVRWQVKASGSTRVAANGQILVVSPGSVKLLDVKGTPLGNFKLPDGALADDCVLTAEGLVMSHGSELSALRLDGTTRWRRRLTGRTTRIHVGPNGEVVVWSAVDDNSTLSCFEANGNERWSRPHAIDVPGFVADFSWHLAFDDAGHLIASSRGRLGDGVSGEDKPTGGTAAYDSQGKVMWTIVPEDLNAHNYPDRACGLARGAHLCLLGGEERAYDERGTLLWRQERQVQLESPTVQLAELDLELNVPNTETSPLVRKLGPRSYSVLNTSQDGAGNRYFVCKQRVISLDAALNPRWILNAPNTTEWSAPAIGGDGTILVNCGEHLMSIE